MDAGASIRPRVPFCKAVCGFSRRNLREYGWLSNREERDSQDAASLLTARHDRLKPGTTFHGRVAQSEEARRRERRQCWFKLRLLPPCIQRSAACDQWRCRATHSAATTISNPKL